VEGVLRPQIALASEATFSAQRRFEAHTKPRAKTFLSRASALHYGLSQRLPDRIGFSIDVALFHELP